MKVFERTILDESEFKSLFLNKQCVIYRNVIKDWQAVKNWNGDYFKRMCPELQVTVKKFKDRGVEIDYTSMSEYLDIVEQFKESTDTNQPIPYCHDVPIFAQEPNLLKDIGDFPFHLLPHWYHTNWPRFVQFFMSLKGSITPLHFDTLMTNNMFFQVSGNKCFTVIPFEYQNRCERRGWRWYNLDPIGDGKERAKSISSRIMVNAGDVLYLPPKMLHHVESLEDSISFNIDFHTLQSALSSLAHLDMPKDNVKYNILSILGLISKDKKGKIFERYSSYLNYCS